MFGLPAHCVTEMLAAPVKEVRLEFEWACARVVAPGIQFGIRYSDPAADDVVPPVMLSHWDKVEYAPIAPAVLGTPAAYNPATMPWRSATFIVVSDCQVLAVSTSSHHG